MPLAEKLDPVMISLLNAPVDDEPVTDEDLRAIEECRESLRAGEPTMTLEDFARSRGIAL